MMHFLVLLFFSFGSFASSEEEVLSQVNKALATLKMGPVMSVPCDISKGVVCSFAEMCSEFRANRNSKNLYQDSQGKVIPNLNLIAAYDSLRQCRDSLDSDKAADKNVVAQNASIQLWQADQLKVQELKKDLLESIRKNKEQSKYIAIEETMTDMALKNSEAGGIQAISSRAQAEQQIKNFEKKSRVRLSEESRKKWVNLLDPTNYKYQQPTPPRANDSLVAEDPFQNTSLLLDAAHAGSAEKLQKYLSQVDAETKRAQKIFEDVRGRIIKVLQGKKTIANAVQVEEMIKRVQTVKFAPVDNYDPGFLKQMGCGSPNAFYGDDTHSFTMCPQMINEPEATIAAVIAHEVGHSIDPCTLTDPLFQDEDSFTTDGEGPPYAQKFSYSDNPLSTVVSCLASKESVGARIADVPTIKKNVENQIQLLIARGATENDTEVKSLRGTLERLKTHVEEKKACSELPGKSEMQEVFADWISAKVMTQKISELPESQRKTYAIEAQGLFLGSDCVSLKPDVAVDMDKMLEGTSCDPGVFNKDMANIQNTSSMDEHPDSSIRVNRIYLAEPEYRKALSCNSKSEAVSCD